MQKFFPCSQWCRSLLNIGGIICNFPPFCPIFNIGGMNLDHELFQVSKVSEDQKKGLHRNLTSFFPRNHVKTTKKVLTSSSAQMQTTVKPELGTCAANISLAIALAPQLFLNGCADACAASILAILSAIAQAQFK